MRSAGNFNSEWGYLAPAPSVLRTARVVLVATAIGATAGAAVVLSLIDRPSAGRDRTASIAAHAIVTSVQAAPAEVPAAVHSTTATLTAPVSTTITARPIAVPTVQAQSLAPAAPQVKATVTPSPVAPQVAMQPSAAATEPNATPAVTSQATIEPPPARIEPNTPPAATSEASIEPAPAAMPRQQPVATNRPADGNSAAFEDSAPTGTGTPASPKSASGLASLSDAPSSTEAMPAEAPEVLIPSQTVPPVKKPRPHYASNSKYQAPNLGTLLRRLFSRHNRTSYYPNR